MGCIKSVFVFLVFVGLVNGEGRVNLTGEWKPNFGWKITCAWTTDINDSLLSVKLSRNGQLFAFFKPQTEGLRKSVHIPSHDFTMDVTCYTPSPGGQRGECVVTAELLRPAAHDYVCETSGERPYFVENRAHFTAFVPPTEAHITSVKSLKREILNCSSSGVPAPQLVWTVNGQKIPEDFTGASWNPTTKLFDAWSLYTQTDAAVTCTPQVASRNGSVQGEAAMYFSHASRIGTSFISTAIAYLVIVS